MRNSSVAKRPILVEADQLMLTRLGEYGVEGSMPGAYALDDLHRILGNGVPVWVVVINKEIIGAVALAHLPAADLTTRTYIRAGFHTPELSRTLKESARYACQQHGRSFSILVDGTNTAAQESMKKVWTEATVTETARGNLIYSTNEPIKDYDADMAMKFSAALRAMSNRED